MRFRPGLGGWGYYDDYHNYYHDHYHDYYHDYYDYGRPISASSPEKNPSMSFSF